MRAWIDGPDGPLEIRIWNPSSAWLDFDDAQEQTESQTYPIPKRRNTTASGELSGEPAARERLFYRVRPTYPQPHTIEGRSDLTVADALGGQF